MSHWIHLSKVPETDLWDVAATRMTVEATLTWVNVKMSAAKEELGVRPLVHHGKFLQKAFKAQFEPLSKEEHASEQISEVGTYKQCQQLHIPLP